LPFFRLHRGTPNSTQSLRSAAATPNPASSRLAWTRLDARTWRRAHALARHPNHPSRWRRWGKGGGGVGEGPPRKKQEGERGAGGRQQHLLAVVVVHLGAGEPYHVEQSCAAGHPRRRDLKAVGILAGEGSGRRCSSTRLPHRSLLIPARPLWLAPLTAWLQPAPRRSRWGR
jgi:hypothetical protein